MERDLAAAILRAHETGGFVEAPSRRGLDLDGAYRVAAELFRERLRRGWRHLGWKAGFTNRDMWARLGLDRPIVAPVYRETVFDAPGGGRPARVAAGRRAALMIEVEVVLGLAGPKGEPRWAAVGAELVDCHVPGWRLRPADAVADFGLHAGLVVGPRRALEGAGAVEELRDAAVSLSAEGRVVATGGGRAALGGPGEVLAALRGPLAGRIAGYGAEARPAGQDYVVSTGTLTPLLEARIGAICEVEADRLPPFSFVLE